AEVAELKELVKAMHPALAGSSPITETMAPVTPAPQQTAAPSGDSDVLDFMRGTTVNFGLDGYYSYNFDHPVGRVNLLRAYDVLSNEFSLSQASVVIDHLPDPKAGRRWGGRLDLQYGQATDTLQGNPSNEPRPEIYRNIFQAYGTYIIPIGK